MLTSGWNERWWAVWAACYQSFNIHSLRRKWIRSLLNFTRQSSHETLGTLSVRLLCLVWQETRLHLHLIQFTQWVMRIVFSGNSRRTTIEGRVHGETIHRWLRQLLDDYYPLFSISHEIIWNVLSGFAFVSFISKKQNKKQSKSISRVQTTRTNTTNGNCWWWCRPLKINKWKKRIYCQTKAIILWKFDVASFDRLCSLIRTFSRQFFPIHSFGSVRARLLFVDGILCCWKLSFVALRLRYDDVDDDNYQTPKHPI